MEQYYNESQREAIRHFKGPCMTLAGPGSGKTAVITERTKYLITEHGVEPSKILVITFTKAAAAEMRERFYKRMEGRAYPVTFGTFHAVFFQILKHAYHYNAGNIIREEQKYSLMRELVIKHKLEYEDETEFIAAVLGEIAALKNSGAELAHYYSTNCAEEVFRRIYSEYHEYLYRHRLIDFEDMLVYTHELFRERKDILGAWQKKFQYILIDEFQDIDRRQYEVIKLLAAPHNNLFIVGDDDQSIYRFRGAKPEIMLHFFEDFPDGKQIVLDINYRSQAYIINASLNLIRHNKERYEKDIKSSKEGTANVEFALFQDQREEGLRIIRDAAQHVERGGRYEDIAVLVRTNTQPRLLMEQLLDSGIPFYAKDAVPNLYDHWIAKDIFSYIRIAQGSRQRSDFLRIINRPKRYISRESLDEETVDFDNWLWFYEEQPWVAERVKRLFHDIRLLERMNPYGAVNYIRRGIGYDEFLKEYADYRRIREDDLYDTIEELQSGAKNYRSYEEWFDHIENYTKELKTMAQEQDAKKEGIAIATLHGAKGLEYDSVYIIDVNEGVTPYKKAVLDSEMEEERRMFYVGMTRARKKLHLFSVRQINHKDAEISRFIAEAQTIS